MFPISWVKELLSCWRVCTDQLHFILFIHDHILVWYFLTDDVVRLFGFNESTATMAQDYARVFVFRQWIMGFDEAYGSLLCIIEHERFYTSISILSEIVATCSVLALILTREASLMGVGIIELSTIIVFFGSSDHRTFALRNTAVVKTVATTALPLGLVQLLQYGEWEVLTILIAALGPAEVTTWGIAESL